MLAADLIRGLKFQSYGEAALAADLIWGLKFQSSGDCAGSRLNQELEILIFWGVHWQPT